MFPFAPVQLTQQVAVRPVLVLVLALTQERERAQERVCGQPVAYDLCHVTPEAATITIAAAEQTLMACTIMTIMMVVLWFPCVHP